MSFYFFNMQPISRDICYERVIEKMRGTKTATRGVLLNSCSQTFCKFHSKTPMSKSLSPSIKQQRFLIKPQAAISSKMRRWDRHFHVDFSKFLRTPLGECF